MGNAHRKKDRKKYPLKEDIKLKKMPQSLNIFGINFEVLLQRTYSSNNQT